MLATGLSPLIAPVQASADQAAADRCTERNGWIPQGVVAPAIPGITGPGLVRFADLDGDGDDDRLLLDEIGGVREWRNDRDGRWSYRGRIASGPGFAPDRVKFADMNGDGRDDYLVVKDNGAIDAWINEGGDLTGPDGITPGWRPVGQIARGTGASAHQIFFGDLDDDGDDDYVTQAAWNQPMYAWRNNGGDRPGYDGWSAWGLVAETNVLLREARLGFGDANCDGRDDLLILELSSRLTVWANAELRDGVPLWLPSTGDARGTGDPIDRIMLAELNGDRQIDYLVMRSDGAVVGYLNNGGDTLP
ncbi:hypothetical protein GCM10022225_79740 [Plantactinospora mayteni]|uniref:VCBS repeat-containing protein n=1 Tax=Plantactinospora mayteni TaxID=566021 RepID=A0ABQ4F3F6_9ACTN|nr:VCBS repeat-containing protein [Plantactinospora mayteni]GIH01430.1 hypothetical protein Pma05_80020 [Plantactinospora mayteni]